MLSDPLYYIFLVLIMVISLPLHELAHARTALAFGDPTAKMMGRVTLNPLAHFDLMGTISFFLIGYGWAKPVPVNVANLHPPRLGDIAVSIAGPLSNFGLAMAAGLAYMFFPEYKWLLLKLAPSINSGYYADFLEMMLQINLYLCVFNLIPLYPLDGHHIQRELLPARMQVPYMYWQMRYGQMTLLALIFVPSIIINVFKITNFPRPLSLFFYYVANPIINLFNWPAGTFS